MNEGKESFGLGIYPITLFKIDLELFMPPGKDGKKISLPE